MVRTLTMLAVAMLCMAAGPVDPVDPVDDLLSGRIDPLTYDYGALHDRPDAEAFLKEAQASAQRGVMRRHGVADTVAWDDVSFPDCMTLAEIGLLKGLSSARKAATHAAWLEARRQADVGEQRRAAMASAILAGGPAPYEQLKGVEKRLTLAREARDPVLAELYRRAAEDQIWRLSFSQSARQFLLPDLTDAALDLYDGRVAPETCRADASNRAWLKAAVAERGGWFTISGDGEEADKAAWIIVQHADRDVAFQRDMLTVLERALKTKDTSDVNYAYLWDRVAVNSGRPQRYATQGRCAGPGDWRLKPMETGSAEARWKAEFGIDWPMADYVAKMNTLCR